MTQTYDFISAATLLHDGIYQVPDYQRNYSWERQQLRDLWEDVSGILPNSDHYTGTVIVKKLENLTKLGKAFGRFELIDGQQRLTTTVIFLASICEELKKRASNDALQTAKNVLTEYIYDAGTDTHKLKLNHGDDSYLREVILKTDAQQMVAKDAASPSELRLRDGRSWFGSQLGSKSEEELQELVNKVLNGLKFTRFQVDTDAEAGLIFEGTNNRGRSLNDLDKIKNYLIYVSYKAKNSPLATDINEAWAELTEEYLQLNRFE